MRNNVFITIQVLVNLLLLVSLGSNEHAHVPLSPLIWGLMLTFNVIFFIITVIVFRKKPQPMVKITFLLSLPSIIGIIYNYNFVW